MKGPLLTVRYTEVDVLLIWRKPSGETDVTCLDADAAQTLVDQLQRAIASLTAHHDLVDAVDQVFTDQEDTE